MATSGSLSTTKYEGRYLILSWTATQSVEDNTSTIKWTLKGAGDAQSSWYYAGNFKVVIAGSTVYSSSTRIKLYKDTKVASGTKTISHNTDGTKSVAMSAQAGIYTVAVNCSGSKKFTLTDIPRKATISSAPNFTSNDNPTITYSNPAGNNTTTLQACISLDGSKDDIAYRNIPKTGTSYTFNLTSAERTILNNATTGNSRTVRFYIKSVIGGKTYTSYSSKTYTIASSSINFSPSIYDTNSITTALTGDNSVMIRYYSNAYASSGAAGPDGATITSQSIKNGSKTIDGSSTTFNKVEDQYFYFYATDSRGNSGSKLVSVPFIYYTRLTCSISSQNTSTNQDLIVNIKGNYFNDSFGAVNNNLTVEYRYKESGGSFGNWISITPTIGADSYTATTTLANIDYRKKYIFEARATDRLATVSSNDSPVMSEPIFDWSKEDFNFNVPININNKTVLREADANNDTILSANGGSVYLRPNGTNDSNAEARLYPDGKFQISGQLMTDSADIRNLTTTSMNIIGDLSLTGKIDSSNLGCDQYNGSSYSTFFSPVSSGTLTLYHIKPFNFIFFRLYISGFNSTVSAANSYDTYLSLTSAFYPSINTALSCTSIKDCSALLNTSGELRVCPRDGFSTGNIVYISGFYPLSSSSYLYQS